jgi:hypothetical protein
MSVINRKVDRYLEALDQGVLFDFRVEQTGLLSEWRAGRQISAHSW